jgi:hypothetical protein
MMFLEGSDETSVASGQSEMRMKKVLPDMEECMYYM